MAKHTPGPWFAINRGTKDEPMMSVMAARIAGKPPRHEVAICSTGDSHQEMENANARLIAAAPDLLAFHDAWVASEVASATGNPDLAREKRASLVAAHKAVYSCLYSEFQK